MNDPILAFDTSTETLTVALSADGSKISMLSSPDGFRQGENLIQHVDSLLKKSRLKINQIKHFLINRGPGSYTGLRIGFSSSQAFSVLKIGTFWGVNSLDLLAETAEKVSSDKLAVCLDARRGKWHFQTYFKKNVWLPASKLALVEETGLEQLLRAKKITNVLCFPKKPSVASSNLSLKESKSTAEDIIRLFQKTFSSPLLFKKIFKKLVSTTDFCPLYLRLPEPEERRRHAAKHSTSKN